MGLVALQRGQLPILVNENNSLHVLLQWKKKPLSAQVSHVYVIRPSTSGPHHLIELVPAFEFSLIVKFESQALRNKALGILGTETFVLDGYEKGPMDAVPLTDGVRTPHTSVILNAGGSSHLREQQESFFTYNSYVRNTELTPGPSRNGIAAYYITAFGNIHEFKRPWLLKVMTPNEDDQTLRVEAQPKENCQLCLPGPPKVQYTGPSKDPRITARELARLDQPELSTTAPPTLVRQPSGSAAVRTLSVTYQNDHATQSPGYLPVVKAVIHLLVPKLLVLQVRQMKSLLVLKLPLIRKLRTHLVSCRRRNLILKWFRTARSAQYQTRTSLMRNNCGDAMRAYAGFAEDKSIL